MSVKNTEIVTTEYTLQWSIYEALNNLDFALSNEEIEFVQNGVLNELKRNE